MKVLIIEDESTAVLKLKDMLTRLDPSIQVIASLESVAESINWINDNPPPGLAFMDIQLSDDNAFEIFKHVQVRFPVIFTTAYDKYIMKSLEHNSIDYLLKPVTEERLTKALEKVKNLETHFLENRIPQFLREQTREKSNIRKRFLVKKGAEFLSVNIADVAYFFTAHKLVFLTTFSGSKYIIDKTLSDLESELDPGLFFRLNRKFLSCIDAIIKFKPDQGKMLLELNPNPGELVTVSKENASNFKQWIEG